MIYGFLFTRQFNSIFPLCHGDTCCGPSWQNITWKHVGPKNIQFIWHLKKPTVRYLVGKPTKNYLTFLMCLNCIHPSLETSSPHLCNCSNVAFKTGCWGGKTTLGMYSKIILPRVSPSQLIFVPLSLVFFVLFLWVCELRKKSVRRHEWVPPRVIILSSFKTMTNHFPGTQDKVTLLGRFPSTDEFAAAPPHRAHTDNYHTNTTGGWQHQISQAWAVDAHAPTYVLAVADHFCPINSWCHCRG